VYDKNKGGWQLINGTLQWVASSTPTIDSLSQTKTKPDKLDMMNCKGSARLRKGKSLTEMLGGPK